jgi:Flp pilus assembly protein TadD
MHTSTAPLPKRPTLELHQMLGFALFRADRRVEGEALMRKAIEMQPDEWLSYYYLGYAYFYAGDPAGALPWFERSLQIARNFPEIQDRVRTIRAAGRSATRR